MATIEQILAEAKAKDKKISVATQQMKKANVKPAYVPKNNLDFAKTNFLDNIQQIKDGKIFDKETNSQKNKVYTEYQKKMMQTDVPTKVGMGVISGYSPINTDKTMTTLYGKDTVDTLKDTKAYKGGEIAGLIGSYGTAYGLASKPIKALPMVGKLGNTFTKGVTKALPKLSTEAAQKIGTGLATGLAADTMIGLPMNINYAYNKEGLRGEEALKNIALNSGIDLVAGGVIELVGGVLLKSGKRVANKAEFDGLKPEEQAEVLEQVKTLPKNKNSAYHYTLPENVDSILKNGFDTSRKPLFQVGNNGNRKLATSKDKFGQDVVYLTRDTESYKKALVDAPNGTGTKDNVYFDYENQKWVEEKGGFNEVDTTPIEVGINSKNGLLIDSAKKFNDIDGSLPNIKPYEDPMEKAIRYAKSKGYDYLEIKDGSKWNGEYESLTGGSGKNDILVFNKSILNTPQAPNIPVQPRNLQSGTTIPNEQMFGENADLIRAIEKNRGVKVQIANLPKGVNGSYQNGVITIAKGTEDPVTQVLKHELTHHLESSGHYSDLSKFIKKSMTDIGFDVNGALKGIKDDYAQAGKLLTPDQIDKEFVAKFAEEYLFTKEDSIMRLARENPNLFTRIYEWISDTLKKVGKNAEVKFLVDAQRKYEKALRTVGANSNGDTQFLFAGASARNADINARRTAELMEAAGKTKEEVFKETGWFKGADGKWRFEIDDSKAVFDEYGDVRGNWDATIEPSGNEFGQLADYLNHEELRKSYPYTDQIEYAKRDYGKSLRGAYYPSTPYTEQIGINKDLRDIEHNETLIHELQHAIQRKERFANGANPSEWERINREVENARAEIKRITKAMPEVEKLKDDMFSGKVDGAEYAKRYKEIVDGNEELSRLMAISDSGFMNSTKTPESLYWNTAGEIEARDAAARMNLTAEERKNKFPNIGGKDTVFIDEAIKNANLSAGRKLSGMDTQGRKLTEAQREFFKESKVVDEEGNLLKVYHGTEADFTVFDMSKGRAGMDIQGSFFSPWELDSKGYGRNVKPYYLNMTNPASEEEAYKALNRFKGQNYAGKKAKEYLISKGYDGVYGSDEVIAFHPNQIKSVDNLNPTSHADITLSQGKKLSELPTKTPVALAKLESAELPRYKVSKGTPRKPKQPIGKVDFSADEIKQIHLKAMPIKKKMTKIIESTDLTDAERLTVNRLLKGEITTDEISKSLNRDNIMKVYDAKRELKQALAPLDDYKKRYRAAKREQADKLLENSDKWKDKKTGFQYAREMEERNFVDVAGKHDGQKLIDEYITPVHQHEARRNEFLNSYRQRVSKLSLSGKNQYSAEKLWGSVPSYQDKKISERALAQMYGEGKITLEQVQSVGADFRKIDKSVKEMRVIYNELFEQANEVLIRNGYDPIEYRKDYFPHFTDNEPDKVLGKLAKKLGFNIQLDELPTDIAGLTHTFKPGKKFFRHILQRKGDDTVWDAIRGFDTYIEGVSDVIHHTDDIQNLRALENSLRYKYSDKGVQDSIDEVLNSDMEETLKQSALDELYSRSKTHLGNLAVHLRAYTDNLAGKKALEDRVLEHNIGRSIYNVSKWAENRVAANMVAVNPGSWLTNFIPLVQGTEVSNISSAKALFTTLKSYMRDDGFNEMSDFLISRKGSDPLYRTKSQAVASTLSGPMRFIDEFTTEVLTRAKYYDSISKGFTHDEAMMSANKFTASVVADRSKGGLPTVFNSKNPLTKLFTMFQVEVNNQFSYLFKDLPRNMQTEGKIKLANSMFKYMVGAYIFNDVYESIVGRRPSLDPFGMMNEFIGDLTGYEVPNMVEAAGDLIQGETPSFETTQKTATQSIMKLGKGAVENLPFVGGVLGGGRIPMSSAIPNVANVVNAGAGLLTGDMNADKAKYTLGKELLKPAYYILPPAGGGQIKKIVETIDSVGRGGSYGVNTEGEDTLQFAIDKTTGNYIKGALFGKYALGDAQKWVDGGFKTMSAKATAGYKKAIAAHMNPDKYIEFYEKQKDLKADDIREMILESGLPLNQKNILDSAFLDSETKYDYSNRTNFEFSQLSDSRKQKYLMVANSGISKDGYMDILNHADANGNDYLDKEEVHDYMASKGYSSAQRRAMYIALWKKNK